MANTIELATKFLPYVDEIFTKESQRSLVTNQDFSWDGAHTIKVYRVTTADMTDYNRAGADNGHWSRYGEVQGLDATTQAMTLRKDRSFTFAIDALDTDETVRQLQAGSALARQLREVVVPEVDTWVYNEMCENAGTIAAAKALTPANILDEIMAANLALDDAYAPDAGRVLVVTPAVYQVMKKAKDIIMETDIAQDMRLRGVIATIDGANVVKVSANRVPSAFGFLLVHPVACVAPVKLEDYKIHDNPPGISGALVEGRINYDAFVLANKSKAIYYQAQA